ncbi:L,D-transpeptidase family protein [Clostridium gasigenes]|uniref:L,D-transpeptidase family protein n=1 Tax=Clostridium gasigenes TaxID=94869 RepID=UPI00311AAB2B
MEAKDTLNKYSSTKVTYMFGDETEILDGATINKWLGVDDNLEVKIDITQIKDYIDTLSKKHNTAGKSRNFKTSPGKIVKVEGGFYGWKINKVKEEIILTKNIKNGEIISREPIYSQTAASHKDNDIGSTYVEINITRQYLWFYKNGFIVTQGDIVTGDKNKNNPTSLGTYMLNYKEKNATLRGANYSSDVTYWMPFNGNIGIHDASWRYSFGGDIYKSNGTHGCVNTPKYLARAIFDKIEDGTPIIVYEDEN